ncbi:serine/threonine-protein kinase [Pontixanthobacter aestiaquae]|uniref:Protein kinase n=1 Tax=Pontixanthobacter aestiaquae TaxID=1509367 RepID=A0A844Z1J3_9SPHN|nr:serine/threonine-protein kinase [Pontixanthobacter aestiaquae]MDN3647219.1 serine/threonine-protein kinase [Pontixanthobacter aestiaquae]MXO81805.1 protein kinase [Pontixanthobacter aestiaquae]
MERKHAEIEREALAAVEDALEHPSDARSSFVLKHEKLSDPAKARAIALLDAGMSGGGLMTGGASACDDEDEYPDRIGGYRVLRLIGRGGMGNVYLAERATDDFDLVVAIKLIKRRLITKDLIERFRRERQILADLNHPNIARLFDGGETEDGVPYFVMEYIDGPPLDRWLKHVNPPLENRIAIFEQICNAVETAHQRLVVHRDLTPPNILVADADTVKLIDFGIARPNDRPETLSTGSAWTPGFAPPEQKDSGEATTLSDVYGLGKLLGLLIGGGAPAELTAIASKAASQDVENRYPSVSALYEDIQNYRGFKPVTAMRAGPTYLFKKFAQRQRLAAAAGTIVAAAILMTLIIVTQAYRETERARAEAEASLADTRALAGTMMFDVFDEVSNRPGNSRARLMLAQNAQSHLEALAADPDASYESRLAAGRGFFRLAAATGTVGTGNLGEMTEGLALYERSADILEKLYAEYPNDEVRLALARTHVSLTRDKSLAYVNFEQSREHGEYARDLLLRIENPSPAVIAELGMVSRELGGVLGCCLGKLKEGHEAIEEGLLLIKSAPSEYREDPAVRRAFNDLLNLRAGYQIVFDGDGASIELFSQALRNQRQLANETNLPADHRLEATIATNLARTLLRMGRPTEADQVIAPIYLEALSAYRTDPADNDLQRRLAVISIARAYAAAQKSQRNQAEDYVEEGLRLARSSEKPSGAQAKPSLNFAHRLQEASEAYWANNQIGKSCELMRQSTALYRQYAEQYQLPFTSLRYRVKPMEEKMKNCS